MFPYYFRHYKASQAGNYKETVDSTGQFNIQDSYERKQIADSEEQVLKTFEYLVSMFFYYFVGSSASRTSNFENAGSVSAIATISSSITAKIVRIRKVIPVLTCQPCD